MALYEVLTNGNPDGSQVGSAVTELIAFYGKTPVVQPSGSTQAAVATTAVTTAAITTTTNAYGYATTTQANDLTAIVAATRTLVNQLRADLVTLGLIKGAA
jgi:hypothetical protein